MNIIINSTLKHVLEFHLILCTKRNQKSQRLVTTTRPLRGNLDQVSNQKDLATEKKSF